MVSLICAVALLTACRREEPNAAEPPVTDALPTTTAAPPATQSASTTTTLDLSAQPTDAQLQDPAYWNAILATLHRVAGDAYRSAESKKVVEPAAVEALRQVYGSQVFANERESITEVAAGRASGFISPPGDLVASVTGIFKADLRCVALTASLDFGKVNSTVPTSEVAMQLLPRNSAQKDANPTIWTIDHLFMIKEPADRTRLCSG